jgi:hypothetical protein
MFSFKTNITDIINHKLEKLHAIMPGGEVYDAALHASTDVQLTACVERIHTEGRASDGGDIGQYSTSPAYVNPAKSPRGFEAAGKSGKTVFARSGKPHLTRYFAEGYKQYREQIGLPSDKVTLTLRGDLRDGLAVIRTEAGYGLGWGDTDLAARAEALEERYGKKIWSPTEQEQANMTAQITETVRAGMMEL